VILGLFEFKEGIFMSLLNEDFDDVQFFALNTKTAEKLIAENRDMITNGMSEDEKKAFDLGVENAFSAFNQLAIQASTQGHLQFYRHDVDDGEEFSGEKVIEWLNSLPLN